MALVAIIEQALARSIELLQAFHTGIAGRLSANTGAGVPHSWQNRCSVSMAVSHTGHGYVFVTGATTGSSATAMAAIDAALVVGWSDTIVGIVSPGSSCCASIDRCCRAAQKEPAARMNAAPPNTHRSVCDVIAAASQANMPEIMKRTAARRGSQKTYIAAKSQGIAMKTVLAPPRQVDASPLAPAFSNTP